MHREMHEKLIELRARVLAAPRANDHLQRLIDSALASEDWAQGELALCAFNGLPRATRQAMMNGWIQPPERPQVGDLTANTRGNDVRLVLDITAEDCGGSITRMDFRVCEDACPVRIQIQEGTKREAALDLINAISKKLELEWESLITRTPDYCVEEARRLIGDDYSIF
jgi:hypothetical protein